MPLLKNKPVRIETGNTRGWQVRFYYQKEGKTKYRSKLFSDGVYGSKEEAYDAAIEYRDEHQDTFTAGRRDREIEPYRRSDRRNNSGVTGIIFYEHERESGPRVEVRAHVVGANGRVRTMSRSLAMHGAEAAVEAVCRFRYDGLQKLHGENNPCPSWQRLYNEVACSVGETYGLKPTSEEGET